MFSFKPFAAATLLATLTAGTAFAAVDKGAEIDVTADVSAIQNEKAAAYWGNLEKDLEAALGTRLSDRMAETGAKISVDIREVELSNVFERALNLSDAVLMGQVNITDDTDNSNFDAYELSITMDSSKIILPEGVSPDQIKLAEIGTPETYQNLISSFADQVVARLK